MGIELDVRTREFEYGLDLARLPAELAARYFALCADDETRAFQAFAAHTRHGAIRSGLFSWLRRFMVDYDAYGWLDMYRMHLLSEAQWRALLELPKEHDAQGHFLDVGAGRGDASAGLCAVYKHRSAIEPAKPLRRALLRRGFSILDLDLCDEPLPVGQKFACITCLNVIDRVLRPRAMVAHLRDRLAPGGQLVISVPIPLRPHVDCGSATVSQEQPLPRAPGATFEAYTAKLCLDFLQPLGLHIERVSRAPYLCQGDVDQPLHVLDALVLVCTAA